MPRIEGSGMIPSDDYHEQERVYLKDGHGDLWRIVAYCDEPTVTLENMETGAHENFGISGLTGRSFKPVDGIRYSHTRDCLVET